MAPGGGPVFEGMALGAYRAHGVNQCGLQLVEAKRFEE
jgi:hypothetical protein